MSKSINFANLICLFIIILFSNFANADSFELIENGKKTSYNGGIAYAGCQQNDLCYVALTTAPPASMPCKNNTLYFDMNTLRGKNFYTTALATKAAGRSVSLIYSVSTIEPMKDLCAISLISMMN